MPPQGEVAAVPPVHEPPANVVRSHTGLVELVYRVSQAEPTAMHT
jgi:hypothetical protein